MLVFLAIFCLFGCAATLQFTDYPATPGSKTLLNIEGTSTLVYQVKGYGTSSCGDAQTIFQITNSWKSFGMMLDGWYGTKSAAQVWPSSGSGSPNEYVITNTNELDLKCDEFKGFWVTWDNGRAQMGTGVEPGVNTLWNVSVPMLLSNSIKYVKLATHRMYYKIATPYNSSPQITVSPSQMQLSDINKASLTDRTNDTCLSVTGAKHLKLKLAQVFSPHLMNSFDVKVITVNMDCSDQQSLYVYVPLTEEHQLFEGSFQRCEFVKQEAVNDKQSCEFYCKCSCDSIFIQKFNIKANAELCGIHYP